MCSRVRADYDNGVCIAGKPARRAVSSKMLETMKSGDSNKADVEENRGLHVLCRKTGVNFFSIVT